MAERTLPLESKFRKQYSLDDGFEKYFPAAIALASRNSYIGGAKHTGGELVHKRWLSFDHGNCISRHKMDIASLEIAFKRGVQHVEMYVWDFDKKAEELRTIPIGDAILMEAGCLMWRAAAMVQELAEKYGDYPLAPAAVLNPPTETVKLETKAVPSVRVFSYPADKKVAFIKAIRTIQNCSLKEAKDISELPFPITVDGFYGITRREMIQLLSDADAIVLTGENL